MPTENQSTVYRTTNDYSLASCGPVFIVEWLVNTQADACELLRSECELFGKARPHGIALLTIINAAATPPAAAERVAIANFLRAASPYVRCSAVVVEGQGFRGALARGVVTGLTMLAKQAFPHKVVTIAEAIEMICTHVAPSELCAPTLRADIERVRARTRSAGTSTASGIAAA